MNYLNKNLQTGLKMKYNFLSDFHNIVLSVHPFPLGEPIYIKPNPQDFIGDMDAAVKYELSLTKWKTNIVSYAKHLVAMHGYKKEHFLQDNAIDMPIPHAPKIVPKKVAANNNNIAWAMPEMNINWAVPEPLIMKDKFAGAPKKKASQETKVGDIYKYEGLSKYEGLVGHIPCRANTTYVGVEVELEGITKVNIQEGTWRKHDDHSLKDKGMEFVTIPIQFKYLEIELNRLFKGLKTYKISSRCSIHVHMNARDFTVEEITTFLLLYVMYERCFYKFSGDRWNNNFCTPLRFNFSLVQKYISSLNNGSFEEGKWFKYFGLNLCPIFGGESHKIGTIEFRHMEGTDDITRIIDWINLIVSLKITAKKISYEKLCDMLLEMNSDSSYIDFTKIVFKEYSKIIMEEPNFKNDIESGITFAKAVSNKHVTLPKGILIPFLEKGRK